jgi:large subunit ribosomal protein L25
MHSIDDDGAARRRRRWRWRQHLRSAQLRYFGWSAIMLVAFRALTLRVTRLPRAFFASSPPATNPPATTSGASLYDRIIAAFPGKSLTNESDTITFEAQSRVLGNRRILKNLHANNLAPAVLLGGSGNKKVLISINKWKILQAAKSPFFKNRIYHLAIVGAAPVPCVVRDLDVHPLMMDLVQNVSFVRVQEGRRLSFSVPIKYSGLESAPGVRQGGLLNVATRRLKVLCTGSNVPLFVSVDVSALNIGDRLFANAIQLPEGVVLHRKPSQPFPVLCSVKQTRKSIIASKEGSDDGKKVDGKAKAADKTADKAAAPAAAKSAAPAAKKDDKKK